MKKVLLIDSGSGGLNVLHKCLKNVGGCDFLLFCDNKNLPYGNKSKEELIEMTANNLKVIKSFYDFEVVVFACCTLTACCLKECQKIFPFVEFVGAVPPVEKAVGKYGQENVVVLATENTIKYSEVLKKFASVDKVEMPQLAKLIDDNLNCLGKLQNIKLFAKENKNNCAIVLGCTHYNAVKKFVVDQLNVVEVFDVCDEVVFALKRAVGETANGQLQIMTSKNDGFLAKLWQRLKEKQEDD